MMEVWIAVRASHSVSLATAIHYFINFLWFLHHLFMPEASKRYCSPNSSAVDALGWSSFTISVSSCRGHVQVWWRWFPCIKGFRAGAASTGRFGWRIWRLKRRKRAGLGCWIKGSQVITRWSKNVAWIIDVCDLHHHSHSFFHHFQGLEMEGAGRILAASVKSTWACLATGQWCSMDPSCLNTSTHCQVRRRFKWLSFICWGRLLCLDHSLYHCDCNEFFGVSSSSICFEILLTSHLRPCNHPCGQSPCMLPWPWFHGAEEQQANALRTAWPGLESPTPQHHLPQQSRRPSLWISKFGLVGLRSATTSKVHVSSRVQV